MRATKLDITALAERAIAIIERRCSDPVKGACVGRLRRLLLDRDLPTRDEDVVVAYRTSLLLDKPWRGQKDSPKPDPWALLTMRILSCAVFDQPSAWEEVFPNRMKLAEHLLDAAEDLEDVIVNATALRQSDPPNVKA